MSVSILALGRRLRTHLRSTRAAIDLASIMVGVIVISIIASVSVATVAAAVPWSQDNAARAALDSVWTAESVTRALDNKFLDYDALQEAHRLQVSENVQVGTDDDGTCYVAASRSSTGTVFYQTSKSKLIVDDTDGEPDTSWCVSLPPFSPPGDPGPGGNPDLSTPRPFGGVVITDVQNDSGDYTGRYVYFGHDGAFDPDSVPYTQSSGAYYDNSNITDVHAWIGATEVPVSQDGWDFYWAGSPTSNASWNLEVDAWGATVGDGMNATWRAFTSNGTLTFRVDGGEVNTFYFGAVDAGGIPTGGPATPPGNPFPAGNDGTALGGDIIPTCGESVEEYNSADWRNDHIEVTREDSECSVSLGSRSEVSQAATLGAETIGGEWGYGCFDAGEFYCNSEANKIWIPKEGSSITFSYLNGATYVPFLTTQENSTGSYYSYDSDNQLVEYDDVSYDDSKPYVGLNIEKSIDVWDGVFNDICLDNFRFNAIGGYYYGPDYFDCPTPTTVLQVIMEGLPASASVGNGFAIMGRNGGRITFTTTEDTVATFNTEPSDLKVCNNNCGGGAAT